MKFTKYLTDKNSSIIFCLLGLLIKGIIIHMTILYCNESLKISSKKEIAKSLSLFANNRKMIIFELRHTLDKHHLQMCVHKLERFRLVKNELHKVHKRDI